MFTGRMPRRLGLGQAPKRTATSCRPVLEALRHVLLPEVLRGAGYATAAMSANMWVSPASGFATGFDKFITLKSERCDTIATSGLRPRLRWDIDALRGRADDGAEEAAVWLNRWLASAPRRPFFWFVNLVECHSPYMPPRPYHGLSAWQRLLAAEEARRYQTFESIWVRALGGGGDISEGAIARMRNLYASSILQMDAWLSRVLETFDRHGRLDDTLVIVTSDHGENLGEAQLIGHAFSLDDRLIRVPLISAGPGAFNDDTVCSLVDVPRMLAAALDIAEHPWQDRQMPDGIAVAQFDPLVLPGDSDLTKFVSKHRLGETAIRRCTVPLTCATDGRLKLMRDGDDELVYDLAEDPLELHAQPLSSAVLSQHEAALEPLRRAALSATVAATVDADDVPIDDAERNELERRMRLLGYM
jgi:arylsulfatase A-like enzyme